MWGVTSKVQFAKGQAHVGVQFHTNLCFSSPHNLGLRPVLVLGAGDLSGGSFGWLVAIPLAAYPAKDALGHLWGIGEGHGATIRAFSMFEVEEVPDRKEASPHPALPRVDA